LRPAERVIGVAAILFDELHVFSKAFGVERERMRREEFSLADCVRVAPRGLRQDRGKILNEFGEHLIHTFGW